MRGYTLLDADLTVILQQGVDKAVAEYPTTSPPEGFVWKALIKQGDDDDKGNYTYYIEWVAKPNGK